MILLQSIVYTYYNLWITILNKFCSNKLSIQLGSDIYAQEYLKIFEKENIDSSQVQIQANTHSGIAHITVTENGEYRTAEPW